MEIARTVPELRLADRKVCLAMGFFDGVHLGHQQIIRQTISDARRHEALAVALSFDQHPRAVLAPDKVPPLIYSLSQKVRTIGSLGVDHLLLLHFDEALCRQPGDVFIRNLAADLKRLQTICVGANFVFGHNRGGNVQLLKALGQELHFAVHAVASVALDGEAVSSTRIRRFIQAGQLDQASQMLGRAYALSGTVVQGDRLGRTLGFPTANIDATGLALPPHGVYAAHAAIKAGSFRAVINIGIRPTLRESSPTIRVEAHLLDFEGDLYGQEIELTFLDRLREERRFDSLDALRNQIKQDIARARELFGD